MKIVMVQEENYDLLEPYENNNDNDVLPESKGNSNENNVPSQSNDITALPESKESNEWMNEWMNVYSLKLRGLLLWMRIERLQQQLW